MFEIVFAKRYFANIFQIVFKHTACAEAAPSQRRGFAKVAPWLRQDCAEAAPRLRRDCAEAAPRLRQGRDRAQLGQTGAWLEPHRPDPTDKTPTARPGP